MIQLDFEPLNGEWSAYDDNYFSGYSDGTECIGHGRSAAEALKDLKEQIADMLAVSAARKQRMEQK